MMDRRCPCCQVVLPIGSGVEFDKDNSVICGSCGLPIVATSITQENRIKPKKIPKKAPVTTTTQQHYGNGVGGYGYAHGGRASNGRKPVSQQQQQTQQKVTTIGDAAMAGYDY
jgi:hypothetical protein